MATIAKFNSWQKFQLDGSAVIDWDTDVIKISLSNSTYVPNAATHQYFSDITNEVTGGNYTAGGNAVATISVAEAAGVSTVDGDDVKWLQSGTGFTTARYGIIYKDTGVASTSPLVGYIDFTTDKDNLNGDLTIQFNALGIFTQT